MPSLLSLIISDFRFEVRDMWLFLSLDSLEAVVRLLLGLFSASLCLREQGGPRRGNQMGNIWLEQWEHTEHLLTSRLIWAWFMAPQNKHQKSLLKDHRKKYNNNEKVWNIVGTTKTWHRDMKSSECYWKSGTKMATKLQSAKSAVSAKHKKGTCKIRDVGVAKFWKQCGVPMKIFCKR